jgi:hypothetical protein
VEIQSVQTFKYLGLQLSANRKCSAVIKDSYQRASKAYFSLLNNLKFKISDDPSVSTKLFDSLIKPITLYCSEVWGFENNDKSTIEKLHTKFCKHVLGVSRTSTNMAINAELNRLSLHLSSDLAMIKYWSRIVQLPQTNLLRQTNNFQAQQERNLRQYIYLI